MDPTFWEFLAQVALETLTLLVLLTGLAGLVIPVFPGLTVMWLATLVYAVVQGMNERMTWVDWLLFSLITLLMIAGNVIDNVIISKQVRDKQVPWVHPLRLCRRIGDQLDLHAAGGYGCRTGRIVHR